jgi:ComF family protein
MLTQLLALVAPPRCALCSRPCAASESLCRRCASLVERGRPWSGALAGLDAAWSAAVYEDVARDLVVALKFGARLGLASTAAAAISERAPTALLDGAIVPVPASPARRRWRGFDSAEEIAVALGARTGLVVHRCLRRSAGRRQVGRPRAERLSDPPLVRLRGPAPGRAILVDDVVTTGATLGACARALRAGGSDRVVALTFARTG